jgi:peptidyl-prolyl cis-trans isomerase A (cyclophilin A)
MFRRPASILAFCTLLCGSATAGPPIARFQSALGDFDVLLDPEAAPVSVANFAAYANRGDYAGTFIHRSTTYNPASIQIVQGGGFMLEGNTIYNIPAQAPIVLETNRSNARGTIAMARTSQPISATSQWFFNLADNNALNPGMPTGGYAVFGGVLGQGMNIVDRIGSAEVVDATGQLGPVFSELPLEGNSLIVFSDIRVEQFAITNLMRDADVLKIRWTQLSSNTPVRVQRSSSLTGPWQTVASNLTTGVFNDTNAPAREAYYRIVTEP